MRLPLAASAALVAGFLSTGASAVDLGPLRGGYGSGGLEPIVRWQGGYFAGYAGTASARFDGSGAVGDIIARELRNTNIENEMGVSSWLDPDIPDAEETVYGVLAGYNFQFGETILGIEADATIGRLNSAGSDQMARSRRLTSGYFAQVDASGTNGAEVESWATLRARAGYTLGAFLPFVTAGVAIGQYETTSTARVITSETDNAPNPDLSFDSGVQSRTASGVAFGVAGGVGLDVALTQNVFLRGEWQHVFFPDANGVEVGINTWRGAAGVKF